MHYLAVAAGIVILAITAFDVVTTVFGVGMGSGPLSRALSTRMAGAARRAGMRQRGLAWVGPLLAALATPLWLGMLWLGWALVFQPPGSVISSTTGKAANSWENAYFAGYSVITLGNGEFQPGGPVWQALTVLASASGLIVVTLGLAYLVALIPAAIASRTIAARIHALGHTPDQICLAAWDEHDLRQIDDDLRSLSISIIGIAEQHLAYPLLHYFHSAKRSNAFAPSLAVLDEAVTIMQCAVPEQRRPNALIVAKTRTAVDRLLALARHSDHARQADPPPPPHLEPLRVAGVPTVSDEEFCRGLTEQDDRRRAALWRLVEDNGWTWEDVAPADPSARKGTPASGR